VTITDSATTRQMGLSSTWKCHYILRRLLEAHELAFRYFDGVFKLLRYDNLKC
jgi:hypothetical protein